MKASRWGNSLGIRLPASVVEALGLAEGDEIEVEIVDQRSIEVRRKVTPRELVERLRRLRGTLPDDFKFERRLRVTDPFRIG
ncbi:MAG: AbrB/MazE/SpoVT family DNA-binding domain-containing protein [Burkholderiaceae bacterium]